MKINIGFIMISLFIITMLIISIRGIITTTKNIQSINYTKSFRKTIGEITSTGLWYSIETNKEADDIPFFEIVKTYEYQVNGVVYSNNKNQLFDDDLLKYYKPISQVEEYEKWILETDSYKKVLKKMNVTKQNTLPIFYDKNNPKTSCLTISVDSKIITKLVMNIIVLVFAVGMMFFFLRKFVVPN